MNRAFSPETLSNENLGRWPRLLCNGPLALGSRPFSNGQTLGGAKRRQNTGWKARATSEFHRQQLGDAPSAILGSSKSLPSEVVWAVPAHLRRPWGAPAVRPCRINRHRRPGCHPFNFSTLKGERVGRISQLQIGWFTTALGTNLATIAGSIGDTRFLAGHLTATVREPNSSAK